MHGDTYDDAYAFARQLEAETGMTFVHPFDDPHVIAGQGTIGMEILRQHQKPIHAIFVAIGGGGLISGIAAYVKRLRPEIKIIGVEPDRFRCDESVFESGETGAFVAGWFICGWRGGAGSGRGNFSALSAVCG